MCPAETEGKQEAEEEPSLWKARQCSHLWGGGSSAQVLGVRGAFSTPCNLSGRVLSLRLTPCTEQPYQGFQL